MNGAIDLNGNYVLPSYAKKGEEYTCPDSHCRRRVFLKRGEVNRAHFCHHAESVPCRYYDRSGESADHKNCKSILRNILEQRRDVRILRKCPHCPTITEYVVPKDITDIREEYPLGEYRRADVGCKLSDGKTILQLEVLYKSRTSESNRRGIWFELKTDHIYEQYQSSGSLVFQCSRYVECDACIAEEERHKLAYEQECLARIECQREKRRQEEICIAEAKKQAEQKKKQEEAERLARIEREREQQRIQQKRNEEDAQKQAEQKKKQEDEERAEREKRDIERAEQLEKWYIERAEERRLEKIREAEEHQRYMAQCEERRRLEKIEKERQEELRKEQQRRYDEIYQEYLVECVGKYKYDPNESIASSSILYKGCEFLHPAEVWRMRHKNMKNTLRKKNG